ncbi:MAG: Pyrimidine-specific ribonucleoside hydrolase RihA [Rhodospirillaceae bacterium]|nr:MAG: Pyrimidine-specific ribonucleoside hydrolase RihA [Rhodospirillaceae bacterium]
MPRPIIIDTDPGQDDALAILLALASPELDVRGITCVAGNVPLALTSRNARIVCELAGRTDVPVYAGASAPLERELVTAEYVHGKTGLDGYDLPEPSMPLAEGHAVDFIIEAVMDAEPGTLTLCALGPLTNLGQALRQAPEISPRLREIVLMGGGLFEGGNTTPAAEFNIYVDPEAADLVMHCGAPVVMIPLDLTHQTLASDAIIADFRAMPNAAGPATAGLLDFFERFDVEKYGSQGGPLHDPNVVAYLLQPDLYGGRHINVEIETGSALTSGMTVADWWRVTDRPANVLYLRHVDVAGYWQLLIDRLSQLP